MKRTALKRKTPLRARRRSRWPRHKRLSRDRLAWIRTRGELARRAKGRCERCGTSRGPFDPHHKRLRSQGGSDHLDNLAFLCRRDHVWAHANPAEARAEGWIIGNGVARA